jgi:prepilin-type N-terminal cleavage/methylation domain-containing protein
MRLRGCGQRKAKAPPRAFTLPEVMVAVGVLSIIAVAYYGGLSSGFLMTQASREDLRATQILMQKMEGLRLCTWSQLSNYEFREPYDPITGTNGVRGLVYLGRVTTNAAQTLPTSVSYRSNMRLVTVQLFWTNYNGRIPIPHSRQMQTHVARYGLQNYIWGRIR